MTAIERRAGGWRVRTASGAVWEAAHVVVATGYNHTPVLPTWPGQDSFTGEVVPAASYRSGEPYRGRSVLVVGMGNTGAEIATDLADHGARPVWVAVRTPPHILKRSIGPLTANHAGILTRRLPLAISDALPAAGVGLGTPDLTPHGLPRPREGRHARAARGLIPVQDVGIVAAIRTGRVVPLPGVDRFDGADVVLADGRRVRPEVVLVATGYRAALEPLVGHLVVLGERGLPRVHGGRPALPGLWFTGFTNPISGMFRELRLDATRIARRIAPDARRA